MSTAARTEQLIQELKHLNLKTLAQLMEEHKAQLSEREVKRG